MRIRHEYRNHIVSFIDFNIGRCAANVAVQLRVGLLPERWFGFGFNRGNRAVAYGTIISISQGRYESGLSWHLS